MIRIAPEANNILHDDSKENSSPQLGKALGEFEYSQGMITPHSATVILCKAKITESYARGVNIDTGLEKLQQELNEKNAEIARLKEELEKVATDLIFWRGRYAELDKCLKEMFKPRGGEDITGIR
jgi:hypothetical protein